jgi:hypothetical protein
MSGESPKPYSFTKTETESVSHDPARFTPPDPSKCRVDSRYNALDLTAQPSMSGLSVVAVGESRVRAFAAPFVAELAADDPALNRRAGFLRPASRALGRARG